MTQDDVEVVAKYLARRLGVDYTEVIGWVWLRCIRASESWHPEGASFRTYVCRGIVGQYLVRELPDHTVQLAMDVPIVGSSECIDEYFGDSWLDEVARLRLEGMSWRNLGTRYGVCRVRLQKMVEQLFKERLCSS